MKLCANLPFEICKTRSLPLYRRDYFSTNPPFLHVFNTCVIIFIRVILLVLSFCVVYAGVCPALRYSSSCFLKELKEEITELKSPVKHLKELSIKAEDMTSKIKEIKDKEVIQEKCKNLENKFEIVDEVVENRHDQVGFSICKCKIGMMLCASDRNQKTHSFYSLSITLDLILWMNF